MIATLKVNSLFVCLFIFLKSQHTLCATVWSNEYNGYFCSGTKMTHLTFKLYFEVVLYSFIMIM